MRTKCVTVYFRNILLSIILMTLKGKTLFITGASRGIGLAIALEAAKDGANIAIAAKTADPNPKVITCIPCS